jgi:D-aminoacyl-tRNA deacylase
MRAAVQRVSSASVHVEDGLHSRIDRGLLVYLGVAVDDERPDLDYIAEKITHLRIFPDADGKMNLDAAQAGAQVLVVSAFTLQADARKGRRPSFDAAARPEDALQWYDRLCETLSGGGLDVKQGKFRAMMQVQSVNDGPICILLDSKRVL